MPRIHPPDCFCANILLLSDRVNPPQSGNRTNLYNWYMCESNYEGYIYNTLNWVYGTKYGPQNPSCQAVNVTRTFTKSS